MITNFKIFENNTNRDDLYYIDKFLVLTDDIDVRANIMLCDRVDFKLDDTIFASFDCFDIYKNNKVSKPVGDNENFTTEKFNKLEFLSPTEFYNKYTEECVLLFNKIYDDYSDYEKLAYWQIRVITNYKRVLETIPAFEYYYSAEKYNL